MKIPGSIFLMVLTVFNLYAQRDIENTERHGARLKAELSLTDQQWIQVRQINERFKAEQSRLRNDTAMTRAAALAQRTKLMEERDAHLRKVLTKEQGTKLDSLLKAGDKRSTAHRKRTNPREEMKETVGLSDEQMKMIMGINRSMGADLGALRTDSVMTRERRGQAMGEIMEARNEKVKKLLTKEQYLKFLEFESENRRHPKGHGRKVGAEHPPGPGRHRK